VLTQITSFPSRHVKNLESRSQLLDAALSSADEANRRWEECRTVVDALKVENGQLRAEVTQLRAENAALHGALANGNAADAATTYARAKESAAIAAAEALAAAEKQGESSK
jgi:hypothetical protein